MQDFLDSYAKYINIGDTLILAISGGVDSMVLLDLVKKSHPKEKIVVAHFDHSLRGDESDADRDLVANICKREAILFEVIKMDIGSMAKEEKSNLEAVARRERYAFLESVRSQYGARYVLTAHHAVDQIETIIGNMVKGAKVRGLSGMNTVSGFVFRPFLTTLKSDVLEYALQNKIEYREDSTNLDTTYDRNRIRHTIIPILESLNPNIHHTFAELADHMQSLGNFLSSAVESWLYKSEIESGKTNTFFISSFLVLSPFFQSEIVSYFYTRAQGGSSQGLSRGIIDEIIRFIGDPGSYGFKEIKKLKIERRGERIIILA